MVTITITKDTFAKQDTVAAMSLPKDKILFLRAGVQFPAESVETTTSGHFKVTFQNPMGGHKTWYLFGGHFESDGVTAAKPKEMVLAVPYFSQRDNREDWWRTCNTSACAMAAEFIKPGSCRGSDDWYYTNCVKPEGDTTDHAAQTRALQRIGIKSAFHYNLGYYDVLRELDRGKPVVIGVLHKGDIFSPYGGHMIVVIGQYKDGLVCHDSWGEGFGDYSNHNGKAVKYPYSSLDGRWLADGPNSGWGRIFTSN